MGKDIDTSDIPEADEDWFLKARLVMPSTYVEVRDFAQGAIGVGIDFPALDFGPIEKRVLLGLRMRMRPSKDRTKAKAARKQRLRNR